MGSSARVVDGAREMPKRVRAAVKRRAMRMRMGGGWGSLRRVGGAWVGDAGREEGDIPAG